MTSAFIWQSMLLRVRLIMRLTEAIENSGLQEGLRSRMDGLKSRARDSMALVAISVAR